MAFFTSHRSLLSERLEQANSAAGARDERARTESLVGTSRDDLGDYLIDINFLAIVSY